MQASHYALTMSEDDLQASVEDLLTTHGYLWFHDEDSRRNESGLPDVIAVHERTGFVIMAELKTEKGRFRPMQTRWLEALRRRNRAHFYVTVWRPKHWASGEILNAIRAGAGLMGANPDEIEEATHGRR